MKIMIFGDSASGKSTFASKLGKKLDLPVLHLDEMMESLGRENKEHIKDFIVKEANKQSWIIEGNAFTKDKDFRIQKADIIFVFDKLPIVTLINHIIRWSKIRFGTHNRVGSKLTSLSLGFFIPYTLFQFPKRKNIAIETAVKYNKKIYFVKSYKQAEKYLVETF
jgi:adenylate kinase family enzyme